MHEKGLRIVILQGMYTEDEVLSNRGHEDAFFKELEDELCGEIESSIGPVERMQFFPENSSQGIVKIKFESGLHAEECIKVMNGRFFDGREIKATFWDGKTDYRVIRETAEELN